MPEYAADWTFLNQADARKMMLKAKEDADDE
jgi:hypothetical protein